MRVKQGLTGVTECLRKVNSRCKYLAIHCLLLKNFNLTLYQWEAGVTPLV